MSGWARREVTIGEGPGHRRDAWFLAEEAGYRAAIPRFDSRFVDLNRDDVARVAPFAGTAGIYLARTALAADLVVSIARMKTHHWAGATLSMKNLFGVVPGAVYGWPKNHLHQVGIGPCVAELNRILPRRFAIVDGIVGMEGNGPIQGRARPCGVLVMGGDLAAVDATCCRIMGIDPEKIEYLRLASAEGHVREPSIEQRGEAIAQVRTPFQLIPEFQHLRLASDGPGCCLGHHRRGRVSRGRRGRLQPAWLGWRSWRWQGLTGQRFARPRSASFTTTASMR